MATAQELAHPRKISSIASGEIEMYLTVGGGVWYALSGDSSGGISLAGTSKTILTAKIDIASSGDNTIIAADANNKIKVVYMEFIAGAENDIIYKHGATAWTGAMPYSGTGEARGSVRNYWPFPLTTAVNEAFVFNLSTAAQVSGLVQYYLEA